MKYFLSSGFKNWVFKSKEDRANFIKNNNLKRWITDDYYDNGKRVEDKSVGCIGNPW